MAHPQNEKITTYWVPLTRVKYKNESEAKYASTRMGLLLNKTLCIMKNKDEENYSIFVLHGRPQVERINKSLEV